MDDITRIVGAALVLTIVMVYLRERFPALAVELNIAFVFGLLLFLMGPIGRLVHVFVDLGRRAQVEAIYLDIALKAIAVAYLTAFAGQVSKDAGESTLAGVIELAGKVIILLLALPILVAILDALLSLLPGG